MHATNGIRLIFLLDNGNSTLAELSSLGLCVTEKRFSLMGSNWRSMAFTSAMENFEGGTRMKICAGALDNTKKGANGAAGKRLVGAI